MTMYFVTNSPVNSHTGLFADPHVERVLNELGGSSGCYAGDESARSRKAREASVKADQFSENAEGTGRDTDHITAANLHVEAARAQSNAAQKSGSDVASEQHRQAATEHLEKGIEHQTAVDNMRRRNRDEEDDDDMTTNRRFGHVGFADSFVGLPPVLNFADDGTASARAGMGPRGGGSGRGPNKSQAMGQTRAYPGQGDEDEDVESARRAAEEGRQRNRQFNDFGAGESQGLVDEPRGSTASPDGRQLWGGQDRANADFPDSAYDDQSLALDASGAPINIVDTVTESNASPRLMQALRDRDARDRENQKRMKLRN